jgi:hypothetical protein
VLQTSTQQIQKQKVMPEEYKKKTKKLNGASVKTNTKTYFVYLTQLSPKTALSAMTLLSSTVNTRTRSLLLMEISFRPAVGSTAGDEILKNKEGVIKLTVESYRLNL